MKVLAHVTSCTSCCSRCGCWPCGCCTARRPARIRSSMRLPRLSRCSSRRPSSCAACARIHASSDGWTNSSDRRLGRLLTHCGMDVSRHAHPCRNRPRVKEKTLKPAGRVIFSLLLPSGLRRDPRQDAGAMDRRVEVTSADGCAVRIRVPARHQSKGGKRCQAKHQADRKARSGSNGRSRPPASA